jgi:hypothetical protein
MATITVRALNPTTWDPLYGNGQNNFISDLAAVTQIINTRMRLFRGEWFLNVTDGLPLFQSILGSSAGRNNIDVITNIISSRILGTPYVLSISSVDVVLSGRSLTYSAVVQTQFGTVSINNAPALSSSLTTSTS